MGTIICYALLIREVTVMVKNEEGKNMIHMICIINDSYHIMYIPVYDLDMSFVVNFATDL